MTLANEAEPHLTIVEHRLKM